MWTNQKRPKNCVYTKVLMGTPQSIKITNSVAFKRKKVSIHFENDDERGLNFVV